MEYLPIHLKHFQLEMSDNNLGKNIYDMKWT